MISSRCGTWIKFPPGVKSSSSTSLDHCSRPQAVNGFSRMRSKGFRFTLGVWGLRVCSLDVAFASATVRNRSREDRMAVPMGSFAEVVLFGGFRRLVAFSHGRRGTS